MSLWQKHPSSGGTSRAETMGQLLRGLLAALVGVAVEGEIDSTLALAELAELIGVEMGSQGAGYIREPRLPQDSIVEQALDQDDFRIMLHLFPGVQTALASGQEAMSEGGAEAATVEVDDRTTWI